MSEDDFEKNMDEITDPDELLDEFILRLKSLNNGLEQTRVTIEKERKVPKSFFYNLRWIQEECLNVAHQHGRLSEMQKTQTEGESK